MGGTLAFPDADPVMVLDASFGGADIRGGKIVLNYTTTAPDVLTPLHASYLASPSWSAGQSAIRRPAPQA